MTKYQKRKEERQRKVGIENKKLHKRRYYKSENNSRSKAGALAVSHSLHTRRGEYRKEKKTNHDERPKSKLIYKITCS